VPFHLIIDWSFYLVYPGTFPDFSPALSHRGAFFIFKIYDLTPLLIDPDQSE
jgi:hypothetical protein